MDFPVQPNSPLRIQDARYLRGCNPYYLRSVLAIAVPLSEWIDQGHGTIGGKRLAASFLERFPVRRRALREHAMPEEFVARLASRAGVPVEEALLQAILAIEAAELEKMQHLEPVAFAVCSREGAKARLAWESHAPDISRRSAEVAVAGVSNLVLGGLGDRHKADLSDLLERAARRRLSGSTSVLRAAARARGLMVGAGNGQHLHLGEGARQQYLFSSLSGSTSFGATKLALDKRSCNRRLAEVFLPVPRQISVTDPDAALAAAAQVGFPVVVKPSKGNQGRGVTVGVRGPQDVEPAFAAAIECESGVLIEELVPGQAYRLLVVDGRTVAAAMCEPPVVTGNGASTVRELIAELNAEPDRDDFRLSPVLLDAKLDARLAELDLVLDDVPEAGRRVQLLPHGHVATGGLPIDVTDLVHPDNRAVAEAAAAAIGLTVAGVDFVTTDIARSFREVGGAILEVNSRPGLSMHLWPRAGEPRDVAGPILDMLFGKNGGFVPKLLVAGDRGTARIARAADHMLRERGVATGLCLKGGAYLEGKPYDMSERQLRQAPAHLLRDPGVECLVAAISLRRVARQGLGLETCDGAVILARVHDKDAEAFDLGLEVLIRANRGRFVVAADDEVSRIALAEVNPARVVLVADSLDEQVAEHCAAGGTVAVKRWMNGTAWMLLAEADRTIASAPLPERGRMGSKETREELSAFALIALAGAVPDRTQLSHSNIV